MSTAPAIQLDDVSKTFGRGRRQVHAVRNVNLTLAAQQVYGFLGPNGAGKSTTIRMMMDLIRPTAGRIALFGQDVRQPDASLRGRVGALVEGARFYPFMTGRENLQVMARYSHCYDAARIQDLLTQVGMADRADRPVRGYSTGMKQRLGIAAALLTDPELVILDEPTNGLDPAGIQEIREFVRRLVAEQGKTVFLSSHLLSEVEQMCDRVAIINQGQLVREGKVGELLASDSQLSLDVTPLERATATLASDWSVLVVDGKLTVEAPRAAIPTIVAKLVAADVEIYGVEHQRQSLEAFFLSVIDDAAEIERNG